MMRRRSFLLGGLAAGASPGVGAGWSALAASGDVGSELARNFIWTGEAGVQPKRFVAFRQVLEFPGQWTEALLHIFADTRYVAWLNGRYLDSGPARFDPRFPEYDSLPLHDALRPGRNVLAVLAQSLGAINAWSIMHEPGLAYVLDWRGPAGDPHRFASGPAARWKEMDAWDRQAPVGWPYAAEWLDARRLPQDWRDAAFDDSGWKPAIRIASSGWGPLQPRSIPLLAEKRLETPRIVSLDADVGRTPDWIWHDEGVARPEDADQSAAAGPRYFRWRFHVPDATLRADLALAAGGDHVLFVNGTLVARRNVLAEPQGVIRFPDRERLRQAATRIARHDLSAHLRPGDNVLALEVRHHLYETRPRHRSPAGLLAQLTLRQRDSLACLISDRSWRSSAGAVDGWQYVAFDDSRWKPVAVLGGYGSEPWKLALGAHAFRVPEALAAPAEFPIELVQGRRIIIDFGGITLARPVMELEAGSGAQMEMSYAERLGASGEPGLSFAADRYTTTAGRQAWTTTDVRGLRYLVLTANRGSVKLNSAAAVQRLYPAERKGSFASSDSLLTALWPRCVETLHRCMEDAYIDTPWRERAQWLADTVACGFHVNLAAFGDTALYRRMLRQIGESQDQAGGVPQDATDLLSMNQGQRIPDGRVEPGWVWAHYPSDRNDIHRYIEDYMLIWVLGIGDYYEQTLDLRFLRSQWSRIKRLLEWFHAHRTPRELVRAREFVYFGNPVAYLTGEGATLNIFYLMALREAARLGARLGDRASSTAYSARAGELGAAIHSHLRQPDGLFLAMRDEAKTHPPSVHANTLALLAGLVPREREASVLDWIEANLAKETISPYMYYWIFETLYRLADSGRAEALVLREIRRKWGPLVERGDSTMPESFSGGSYCHIAGTAPAWAASSGVLGVRIIEREGVRQLRIRPRLGDLEWAEGAVPTTLGLVWLKHRRTGGSWRTEVTVPQGAPAWIGLPGGFSRASLRLNGSPPASVVAEDAVWWIRLAAGRHIVEAAA